MEVTGRAVGASLDFKTNHFLLTFEINENELVKSEYDRLKIMKSSKLRLPDTHGNGRWMPMHIFMC